MAAGCFALSTVVSSVNTIPPAFPGWKDIMTGTAFFDALALGIKLSMPGAVVLVGVPKVTKTVSAPVVTESIHTVSIVASVLCVMRKGIPAGMIVPAGKPFKAKMGFTVSILYGASKV